MRSNDEIINLLTEIRKEKNMSISEMARQIGMAKSAVSRYFNKTREFPLNRADQFAKVLGISPEYLLGLNNSTEQQDKESIDILESTLIKSFRKLDVHNKRKVIDYANLTLIEQDRSISSVVDGQEIYTLAAHSDDPSKKVTKEDLDNINTYLDDLDAEFNKKNRNK